MATRIVAAAFQRRGLLSACKSRSWTLVAGARGNSDFTHRRSDHFTFDPKNIKQEPEDEKEDFERFIETYGRVRLREDKAPISERDFVVTKDPKEWEYVQRLLPKELVPEVVVKDSYPSGFVPVLAKPGDHPYFVNRTVNHMLPVYVQHAKPQAAKSLTTIVRRVDGDLFRLRDDLKAFLFQKYKMDFISQVVEVLGAVKFRGDFEADFKEFLLSKGF